MEEDILILEILEMFIEDLDELDSNEEFVLQDGYKFQVKQAIENLIKRNKELEKENKMFKDFYVSCGCTDIAKDITATQYHQIALKAYYEGRSYEQEKAKQIVSECIPKSVIKEKIEEHKKLLMSCNRFSDVDRIKAINERILICKELLGDENK